MMDEVIGFSTEQWYCNECGMTHYEGHTYPCMKKRRKWKKSESPARWLKQKLGKKKCKEKADTLRDLNLSKEDRVK